ncbi:MAG: DnaJ domain-containing protein [Phormidesmis sp.]
MRNIYQAEVNHYETLGISATASQAQVKQAYRKLAKQFHPDGRNPESNHDKIARVNAAYEVLGDAAARREYDAARRSHVETAANNRAERAANAAGAAQGHYRKKRTSSGSSTTIEQWLRGVYNPTDRLIGKILKPLKTEVRALSADPFDDELMAAFQVYIETCQDLLAKAQAKFKSMPNPAGVASGAANLYYCLNQLEDGIEEIERFTYTYDDSYLHTGQELFRIATGLRRDAKAEINAVL